MSHRIQIATLATALLGAAIPSRVAGIELKYLYDLATLTGSVRLGGLNLSYDPEAREVFALGYGTVRIFNTAGVQTYSFSGDEEYGFPGGVAALEDGELVLLTYRETEFSLVRANFRGEPQERLKLTGLPADLAQGFRPNGIVYAAGKLYLPDFVQMKVLVTDVNGAFLRSYDVAEILGVAEKRQDLGLNGFSVDKDGNLLFTVAALFKVYVMSPEGGVQAFGTPGGAPGRFNLVNGVASDDQGRIYVVDGLKCAVIVFDRQFKFLGEFGYRGRSPGRLIAPGAVAVGNGNVYVSQNGGRGVTVYRVAD